MDDATKERLSRLDLALAMMARSMKASVMILAMPMEMTVHLCVRVNRWVMLASAWTPRTVTAEKMPDLERVVMRQRIATSAPVMETEREVALAVLQWPMMESLKASPQQTVPILRAREIVEMMLIQATA